MLKQIGGHPSGNSGLWTATCDVCGEPLGGLYVDEAQTMKRLLAHMRGKHPDLALPRPEVGDPDPEEETVSTQDWIEAAQAQADADASAEVSRDLSKALAALRAVLSKCDQMEAEAQVGGFIAREFRGVVDKVIAQPAGRSGS